jgi:hypothetical protein
MTTQAVLRAPHIVRGRLVDGSDVTFRSRDGTSEFVTPALDLDELVWPRHEQGPAFDTPIEDIIDFLAETGEALRADHGGYLEEAVAFISSVNPLGERVLRNIAARMPDLFNPTLLRAEWENGLGSNKDGWRPLVHPPLGTMQVRPYPPRLVHVMAGNSPGNAAVAVIRGALCKAVNLLKLPSNDLFSAPALLRTMADIDPNHPVVRSFTAVYWAGGDASVESVLYRPQFFDKVVAWGGHAAITNVVKYLGPGLELVQFDPKMSISIIGCEVFADEGTLRDVARRAADDATVSSQESCTASRFQFVEGSVEDVDRYCELLVAELGIERPACDARYRQTPADIREEVDVLRTLEPSFRVWGNYDGDGLVVRSDEPVDFHPIAKTVNVIPVPAIGDVLPHVTVATQTVGVFPHRLKSELRDRLANAGVQRIVPLGGHRKALSGLGYPHDAMVPLHRMVRWVCDE